jgi:hypothetical protein
MEKIKCHECSKKLSVSNYFECKCLLIFCSKHRYMESHNCEKKNDEINLQKKKLKENLFTVIEKKKIFI